MQRKKVPHQEVARVIAELQRAGATRVRCGPLLRDGRVEVRWVESELERARYAAELEAWRLPMVLAVIVAALLLVGLLIAFI